MPNHFHFTYYILAPFLQIRLRRHCSRMKMFGFLKRGSLVSKKLSRVCKSPVSSSSSPLTPDVFFMKAGDTIISSSMATTYKQGVFSASQFYFTKKQLSPACPTSWQA